MIPIDKKPLKIYNASAGSGKTFNLVLMYLKLILNDQVDARHFSKIIAMTFTNKAAIEMKNRIIDALNTLGNFDEKNKKSIAYLSLVAKESKIDKKNILSRSKEALKNILHQYEQFNVLTIDKFNLRLIRSFSRDLNINTDFQTTTNEKEVINEIVDLLIDEINQPDFHELTEITLKYAKENIENESKWDFNSNVKSLAEIITKENYIEIIQDLLKVDFSIKRYEVLKHEINEIKQAIKNAAKELHTVFFSYDTANVPGKSKTVNAFEKLLTDKLFDFASNSEYVFSNQLVNYLKEGSKTDSFSEEVQQKGLIFIEFHQEKFLKYVRLEEFRKNFFNLAILQYIAKELEKYKKSDNIVLISEFNKLISDLLKNEEAPYIYERIGNRYQHYLLDEFQDTSRLQWVNLVPLVHDSLGNLNKNLIVGDPKQSIYRFKNGLAEQFIALPKIYNPENDLNLAQKSAYFLEMGESIQLNKNWRSKCEIVQFNNLFFTHLVQEKKEIVEDYYKDVIQEFNPNNKGAYVYFKNVPLENKSEIQEDETDEDETTEESGLIYLLDWIEDCLNSGYDKGDICLLGYSAKDCNKWATFLTENNFKVVSADSLLLGSNQTIHLIISYLKWRINPSGELEAKRFVEQFFYYLGEQTLENSQKYWKIIKIEDREKIVFNSQAFLIEHFGNEENFFFHYENLYQLIQKLYRLIKINELENPYVHQFSDYIFQFDQTKGPNIKAFVENFESEGHKIAVQIPENKEAIKILTVHKSKGLEFPIVLIPNLKWDIFKRSARYLIQDKELIYFTSINKNSKIKEIQNYYEVEYNKALLDKINLMYVAFTRPKDRLYIMNEVRKKGENQFDSIVSDLFSKLESKNKIQENILEFGQKSNKTEDEKKELATFTPQNLSDYLWFPDISLQDKEELEYDNLSENRRFGNQLHELISIINNKEEIDEKMTHLIQKGKIETIFSNDLRNELNQLFMVDEYLEILKGSTEILREQDIIISENEIQRPDLIVKKANEIIVLDYKTGQINKNHQKQIKSYCNSIKSMNFQNVKGYLFYTSTRTLERIV
jgi:ATP-dependent exoDNAse (exonuclease V) beta subunit